VASGEPVAVRVGGVRLGPVAAGGERSSSGRRCLLDELPAPPDILVLVHAGGEYALKAGSVERTRWSALPDREVGWWADLSEERRAWVRRERGTPDDWSPPRRDVFPDSAEEH
jgi:hypothetical protein